MNHLKGLFVLLWITKKNFLFIIFFCGCSSKIFQQTNLLRPHHSLMDQKRVDKNHETLTVTNRVSTCLRSGRVWKTDGNNSCLCARPFRTHDCWESSFAGKCFWAAPPRCRQTGTTSDKEKQWTGRRRRRWLLLLLLLLAAAACCLQPRSLGISISVEFRTDWRKLHGVSIIRISKALRKDKFKDN